jgi:hypothetical protein
MEANLEPEEEHLMEAEAYLRSARELLEVIETRVAPAEAPPRSPIKAVVGFLRAGEPIEGHHRQDGRREARVGTAASGGGDPRGDERAVCQDQVSTRRPPRGMVWSLRKRAWCPPGEFGGRRRRRQRHRERGAGDAASRRADEMVPRDGLAALKMGGEKRVTAERHERPPPEAPGGWSGGETVGTDTGGRPERVETGPSSDGGGITASACGECGRFARQHSWLEMPEKRPPIEREDGGSQDAGEGTCQGEGGGARKRGSPARGPQEAGETQEGGQATGRRAGDCRSSGGGRSAPGGRGSDPHNKEGSTKRSGSQETARQRTALLSRSPPIGGVYGLHRPFLSKESPTAYATHRKRE